MDRRGIGVEGQERGRRSTDSKAGLLSEDEAEDVEEDEDEDVDEDEDDTDEEDAFLLSLLGRLSQETSASRPAPISLSALANPRHSGE